MSHLRNQHAIRSASCPTTANKLSNLWLQNWVCVASAGYSRISWRRTCKRELCDTRATSTVTFCPPRKSLPPVTSRTHIRTPADTLALELSDPSLSLFVLQVGKHIYLLNNTCYKFYETITIRKNQV